MTPLLFVGTLCVLVLRSYTLVRQVERGQKKGEEAEAVAEANESGEPVPDSATPVRDEEKAEPAKGSAPAQA